MIRRYTAQQLFDLLNDQDERDWIEAKGGSDSSHSVMETVCAYANEPDLGGGYILMGVAEETATASSDRYKVIHIDDPDKFQSDLVSQCASMFSMAIRPEVAVEKINGDTVIKVFVHELPPSQKPLYFKADGLPQGAYRRIGPTDQRCTEDDMQLFYTDQPTYESGPVQGSSLDDIDSHAIAKYRDLRSQVNATAEELGYDDKDLLAALGATASGGVTLAAGAAGAADASDAATTRHQAPSLTLAGVILFGSAQAQRRLMPMMRVDYIRVPGTQWISDPDERFSTIDMRGPMIMVLSRLMDAINADLPRGFHLAEGALQAESTGLPTKALREALVNAIMHRSYRVHSPTQVIRYDNRIEIINPGFSLKAEDQLGEPGSKTRNPHIAAVFHDTNLAETKGSGIRAMRRLMQAAELAPPTFGSDRSNDTFTTRLLLHHFLSPEDLDWLSRYDSFGLNQAQKQALIFVREVGAIDNKTYRQIGDLDLMQASQDLRGLRDMNLFDIRGKGRASYYIPGHEFSYTAAEDFSAPPPDLSAPPPELSAPPPDLSAPLDRLPEGLQKEIAALGKRIKDPSIITALIKRCCESSEYSAQELAMIFEKSEKYILRKFLTPMISTGDLQYKYPDMVNHPNQRYLSVPSK